MNDENQTIEQSEVIKNDLDALVEGLSFPSETDAPIAIISFDDVAADEIEAKLKADAGEQEATQIDFKEFSAMYGTVKDWQNTIQKDFAQKFGAALQLIQSSAQAVKVYRLGGVRADLYIIGEMSATRWLGMKTKIVET